MVDKTTTAELASSMDNNNLHDYLSVLTSTLEAHQHWLQEGISEYDLIQRLASAPHYLFDKNAMQNSHTLFQTHFVLFHCLYQLADKWCQQHIGCLDIVATHIKLSDWQASEASLQKPDPMRAYYLDLSQLQSTTEHDIHNMLDRFWQMMAGSTGLASQLECEKACKILEVPDIKTLDFSTLKKLYRKQQHKHHPDKGGTSASSQQLSWAYQILVPFAV